jgi:hypothetical protein
MRRVCAWLAATAELGQVHVFDVDLAERDLERPRAELRMSPRSRQEPYVRERFYVRRLKDRDELNEWPRAMSDRPNLHRSQCASRYGSVGSTLIPLGHA